MTISAIAALSLLVLFASATPASADLITIGLQEPGVNGGAITVVASGDGSAFIIALSYGTFTANSVVAIGSPILDEPHLDSSALNISSPASGTLTVYVTEQNIGGPTGMIQLLSSFTENLLNGGITSVTEATYVDPGNNPFGLVAPLASHTFMGIGTAVSLDTPSLGNPYSETAVYTITATDAGDVNATIDINVPEPASLALLGTGVLGLGVIRRRRRRA